MGTCKRCGAEGPVREASFVKSASAVIVNWYGSVSGAYCRDCVWSLFRGTTGYTALRGWWSPTGILTTPFFLVWNVFQLLKGLWSRPVPERTDGGDPLEPHADEIRRLVEEGASLDEVAEAIAPRTDLDEEEVRRELFPLQKYM